MRRRRHRPVPRKTSSVHALAWFAAGAVSGFAINALMSQRNAPLRARLRGMVEQFGDVARFVALQDVAGDEPDPDAAEEGEREDNGEAMEELEWRVLDELESDAVLSRRAIEIGAVAPGVVELTGWVRAEEEAARASALAGRAPGVESVVNRLVVRRPSRPAPGQSTPASAARGSQTEGGNEG